MGYPVLQSSTAQPLLFKMVLASDHVTPATGLTPVVTLSKSGAAFGAAAGAVTELSSGWYKVAGNATDSNTLGPLALHAAVATADNTDDVFPVVSYNPQDTVRLGLTALPNAAAGAVGGLAPAVTNSGTAQAGGASTIMLTSGASAVDSFYVGQVVLLTGGTGTHQAAVISAYVGSTKVATVSKAWSTAPDNTTTYSLLGNTQDPMGMLNVAQAGGFTPAVNSPLDRLYLTASTLFGKATVSADGKSLTFYLHDGVTSAVVKTFPASVLVTPTLPETVTTSG